MEKFIAKIEKTPWNQFYLRIDLSDENSIKKYVII